MTKLREKFDSKVRDYIWLDSTLPFEPGLEECRVSVVFYESCDVMGFHIRPIGEEKLWDVFEHFVDYIMVPQPFPSSIRPGSSWTVRVKNRTDAPRRFCAVLLVEYPTREGCQG